MVVGAGRGIGRNIAELFSEARANVVISSRNEAELRELEYQLNAKGNPEVLALAADAEIPSDVESLVKQSVERFGRIDYLIHTAGMGILKPFAELKAEDLQALLNANLMTAFNVFRSALPVMQEQKFGRIIAFFPEF